MGHPKRPSTWPTSPTTDSPLPSLPRTSPKQKPPLQDSAQELYSSTPSPSQVVNTQVAASRALVTAGSATLTAFSRWATERPSFVNQSSEKTHCVYLRFDVWSRRTTVSNLA